MVIWGDCMRQKIFIVLNLLILVGSLGVGFFAYNSGRRHFADDVIYIAPLANENRLFFHSSSIEALEFLFPRFSFAAVGRYHGAVSSSTHTVFANIIYTNSAYFEMHLDFIDGSRVFVDEYSIIINEALAWRLFGTAENVVGLDVLFGGNFVVTGVVRQHRDAGYTAWLSRDSALAAMPVSSLYFRSNEPDPLALSQAHTMLVSHLHSNFDEYAVVNITRFVESMNVRTRLLLYLVLASVLVFFLRRAWPRFKFIEKKPLREIFQLVAFSLAGAMLFAYILWGVNGILLWLPNLSSPSVSLFEEISSAGVLPPDVYLSAGLLQIARLNRIVNAAFIAGMISYVNLLFFDFRLCSYK